MLLLPEHPAIEFGFIDCNSLLGAMFPEYQDGASVVNRPASDPEV